MILFDARGIQPDMRRPRVLVVDDEPSLLETMAVILESNGFEPVTAAAVPAAIELVRAERFGALLADLSMPGDGRAVIHAMRQVQPRSLIVVITGHIMPEELGPEVRAQADEVMLKPTNIPRLIAWLRERLPPE